MDSLRLVICGSVDDGKSTLIGRLLHESKSIFEDQLQALEADSKKYGTQGDNIDFALLVDGLQAEREQGITIDVAYRFFCTSERKFIVADTPGHEQYTRNMATGASTAALAIIVVDARKGLLSQTRRHARIASMMGIRSIVLAVNKMDLVGFEESAFRRIEAEFRELASGLQFAVVTTIPVCALRGDNIVALSANMPWHLGPTLLAYLNTVEVTRPASGRAFRMPVQWVNRPNLDFRGFCGRIAQGQARAGDRVQLLPSHQQTRIKEIVAWNGHLELASEGGSVTLTLTDDVEVSRGDVIAAVDDTPGLADQFEAKLLWMAERTLLPGRSYLLKLHTKEVSATVTHIKYRVDVNTGAHLAAKTLALNEIAIVNVSVNQPVAFEPYAVNRTLGGFILIDKLSYETVAAGMINFALRRATSISWQALEVDKSAHAALKQQTACCIWFTGLSGSGKSTIANLVEKRLHVQGRHTMLLDGDNVRHGLNRDLGFTEADRVENIRRVAEVARLMVDAGLIVLVSLISPYRADRNMARNLFAEGEFVEVFVDTPLDECERRDPKGLYGRARRGELKNFTGIDSGYEPPEQPDVHLFTMQDSAETCASAVLRKLE